jgi:hypothetical protein
MDEEFRAFLEEYLDNKFDKLVECKEGKMPFDVSTNEKACESATNLEKEIINANINLLYAYHQWLKENKK